VDDEALDTVIELTHNWGDHDYALGTGFGHIALGVANVVAAANTLSEAGVKLLRPAGPLKGGSLIFAGLTHFV
jgi:lactoylglutathione lyase